MLDSHRKLLMSGAEWDAFMDDIHQTLAKFGVPERERGEHEGRHRDVGGARHEPAIAPSQLTGRRRPSCVATAEFIVDAPEPSI
jgi:hypothetical protein